MLKNCEKADIVLFSNAIYTLSDDEKRSGGVAVQRNKIVNVGTRQEVETLIGPHTKVYELGDRMVIPGFIEGHAHIDGPLVVASRANLRGITSQEECVRIAKEWADNHPDDEWVNGFGWHSSDWPNKELPTKRLLDQAIPDRPVQLIDIGGHSSWMNSKALEKLGIGKDEIDLKEKFGYSGKVYRDENGEPTGLVLDGPLLPLYTSSLEPIHSDVEKFIKNSARLHLEQGITSIHDMWPYSADSEVITGMQHLEEKGELDFRIFFQLGLLENDIETVVETHDRMQGEKLRMVGLKAIADSVWADRSGAALREYKGTPGNYGELYLDPQTWGERVCAGNKYHIPSHLHCSGNRAVRAALDLYEQSIKKNGEADYRNTIEHCDTVHPDDVPRFAKLGVMANVTPDLLYKTVRWQDSPVHDVYDDETRSWAWPFKSLIDSGAMVTFGVDSPCSTFNPLVQIFRAVNRVCEDYEPVGGFLPKEKVSVLEALRCYTYNGAYEAFMEDKLGTLEEGKLADIVVLDRDIVEIDPLDIRNAVVLMTIADGKVAYEK